MKRSISALTLALLVTHIGGCLAPSGDTTGMSAGTKENPFNPDSPPPTRGRDPGLPKFPESPAYVAQPLDTALQDEARAELARAFASRNEVIRAQSLEATAKSVDRAGADRVLAGLKDPQPLVRFAAAMAAGDMRLPEARPQLLKMTTEVDPNVRIGVRYALHRLGDKRLSKEFEALSTNPEPRVRGNTAIALGQLGEPTAVRVLKPMLADENQMVRLQAAEAMWRLKDKEGLESLVAALLSDYADDQMTATLALAAPRDRSVSNYLFGKLVPNDPDERFVWVELQLVAARALGQIGIDRGFGLAAEYVDDNDARRRSLSALALGDIGRTDAQPMLRKLLKDNNEFVRVAAALAVRKLELGQGSASLR
jgi:HEAT repeat protein